MGKNYFTEEQIKELRDNPYVKNVSEKAITYTDEFREEFYRKYEQGKSPSIILVEMGFNPKTLGRSRIDGISKRIFKMASREQGFSDTRNGGSGRPKTREMTPEQEIAYLKNRIAYQRQEIEFLKKINSINRKAAWKQKAKNSD